jgi:hypothetical protein
VPLPKLACASLVTALIAVAPASAALAGDMTFQAHTVAGTPPDLGGTSVVQDLYEPDIVAAPGAEGKPPVLYVTGHSIGVYTTRAPAFVSTDGGASWSSLPGILPGVVPGGGHVNGDEGIIVTDPAGHAWQFDNGAETGAVYGWSGWGASESLFDPNAYDIPASFSQSCRTTGVDRPWLAYGGTGGNGDPRLLLVNNGFVPLNDPGNVNAADVSQLQLGLYDTKTQSASWNMCASHGFIPGVPAVRTSDGAFAAPQLVRPTPASSARVKKARKSKTRSRRVRRMKSAAVSQSGPAWTFALVQGDLDQGVGSGPQPLTRLFNVDNENLACEGQGGGANWGWAAYDAGGNEYALGATNDTHFAIATNDGTGFQTHTFDAQGKLWFLWISGSTTSDGALVTWAESGESCEDANAAPEPVTFHAAHVAPDGTLSDSSVVVRGVDQPCGDYHGSSLGPDGKAYVVAFSSPTNCGDLPPGRHPLTAYVQTGGPTLP